MKISVKSKNNKEIAMNVPIALLCSKKGISMARKFVEKHGHCDIPDLTDDNLQLLKETLKTLHAKESSLVLAEIKTAKGEIITVIL